jgi:hypothetical protein
MTDYNAMSLDELLEVLQEQDADPDYDPFYVALEWARYESRRAARDAILDMAEQLDAEGLVIVPRNPTPRMLHAADGYTDLIQPFEVVEVPGENRAKEATEWRHNEFKCAWWAMIAAAPLAPEVG